MISPPARALRAWLGIAAFYLLEGLVGLQAWLAAQEHFLTATQMQAHGVAAGLPFLWHFGMAGDALIISPLLAYILGAYFQQWRGWSWIVSLLLGCAAAAALNWSYTLAAMPGVHVRDNHLTSAGSVHAIYMAMALPVFLQFYFFTPEVSARLMRFASLLVLVHVFFGTHMVLGIISMLHPLEWYPEKPLKSIPGWVTFGALATGLLVRNLGMARLRRIGGAVAGWLYRMYVYWTGQDDRTTEGFLKLLDNACGWTGPLFLAKVLYDDITHSETLQNGWLTIVLAGTFCTIYFFGRHSVKRELLIAKDLFVPGNVPDDYATNKSRLVTGLLVTAFVVLYCAIVWYADYIWAVAPIMFGLACNDYRTRAHINENFRRYFSDPKFAVPPDYKGYAAILAKRRVASWFLFELDHLAKERARAAGCALAALIAAAGYLHGSQITTNWAYGVLITTLVLNEILTGWWRYKRETELGKIGVGAAT